MSDVAERFWSKVDKRGPDECWPWLARAVAKKDGRGLFWNGHRMIHASRAALMLEGRLAWEGDTRHALHTCDNPACCNPAHLVVGTNHENILDCRDKGRMAQQKRTHCPQGHAYDAKNTYLYGNRRYCRACIYARTQVWRKRRATA